MTGSATAKARDLPLQITNVEPGSLASQYGIIAGDSIITINGHKIRDFLDLEYYGGDYQLHIHLQKKDGKKRRLLIVRDSPLPLGISSEMPAIKRCQNHCVFCFIDQMPPGLRQSLYVKDDDYLCSRDFGNYITLTNLSEAEFKRIISLHLSPLYISVHTTDKHLRQRMMRHKKDFDVMAVLEKLSAAGIGMHTQIVCVPGYNDGQELENTVRNLLHPSLNLLSIGIVPVGLTRFRQGLHPLHPFDSLSATRLLQQVESFRQSRRGEIVQAADEFYVLSGRRIPPPAYYQDYPQAENGIGLLSLLRQGFARRRKKFAQELESHPGSYLLLHSKAAAREMAKISISLNKLLKSSRLSLQEISNHFMGPHISVSGLITACDVFAQHGSGSHQILILPANMFNSDDLTLDGLSPQQMKAELKRDLFIVDELFCSWQRV